MSNPADKPFAPSEVPAPVSATGPAVATAAPKRVAVIPDGTLQFIDGVVSADAAARVSRRYFEDNDDLGSREAGALYVVSLEDGVFHHPATREIADAGLTYVVGAEAALDAFAGAWLPVPLLRVLEDGGNGAVLDAGPTNWARVFIARAEAGNRTGGWHVATALDTHISAGEPARERAGPSPSEADVKNGASFRLSADENDVGEFITEAWVDDWLSEVFSAHVRARHGERDDDWQKARPLEHVAHYLTLLAVLSEAGAVPEVQLAAGAQPAITVDLVVDIGAARTTVLLRDNGGDSNPSRPPIEPLTLRDISRPWLTYRGILPSRITFARSQLGKEALSRWSGRANAFYWPSLARIGVEAERLAASRTGGSDRVGVSSVMRYLWDDRRSADVWRFARAEAGGSERGSIVSGPLLAHIGETGGVLGRDARMPGTTKPRFSRSSLMTFFMAEIIVQALSAINAPKPLSEGPEQPRYRRIGRVLLTVPGNVLDDSQRKLKARVEEALALVWTGLGWRDDASRPRLPEVVFTSDSATNAQTVFLYNEIVHKFRGDAREYFDLMGKARPGQRAGRSLRVGAFDIGGGTTAISVATYELGPDGQITRLNEIVDGLPGGGDDAVKAIIEQHILPAIAERLADAGLSRPERFLARLLETIGSDRAASRRDGFAARFAAHLARPAAIALLKEHAAQPSLADEVPVVRTLGALAANGGADARVVADTLDELAAEEGADSFSPLQTPITFIHRELAETIGNVLQPVLSSAIRLVQALDCDIVLLSGWPSRLPVVLDKLIQGLPTRPNRIIPLHDYRIAEWYPGRLASERIAQPKTTAAVGGLLEAIGALQVIRRGTAEEGNRLVIGRLSPDRTISADDVLFSPSLPGGREGAGSGERSATITAELPLVIGVRRLVLESWPATPLYQLDLKDASKRERPKGPLKLTLERVPGSAGSHDGIAVTRACDAAGNVILPSEIEVSGQMLADPQGHWLDTGAISLEPNGDRA